jgi:hypothetical protein
MTFHFEFDFPAFEVADCPLGRRTDFALLKKTVEQGHGLLTVNQEMCLLAVCLADVWKCTPAQMFEQYDFAQHFIATLKQRFHYTATLQVIADFTGHSRAKVKKAVDSVKLDTDKHEIGLVLFEKCRSAIRNNHNLYSDGTH